MIDRDAIRRSKGLVTSFSWCIVLITAAPLLTDWRLSIAGWALGVAAAIAEERRLAQRDSIRLAGLASIGEHAYARAVERIGGHGQSLAHLNSLLGEYYRLRILQAMLDGQKPAGAEEPIAASMLNDIARRGAALRRTVREAEQAQLHLTQALADRLDAQCREICDDMDALAQGK